MARAGCIVFIPNGGGQKEIVSESSLVYNNIDDAVEKIDAMIKNKKLQDTVRKILLENSRKFSVERFKKEIIKMVESCL